MLNSFLLLLIAQKSVAVFHLYKFLYIVIFQGILQLYLRLKYGIQDKRKRTKTFQVNLEYIVA